MTQEQFDAAFATAVVLFIVALVALATYWIGRLDEATAAKRRKKPTTVTASVDSERLEEVLDKRLDSIRESGHPALDPRVRS